MEERTLEKLEFPKVLVRLGKLCTCSLGRERAQALRPSSEAGEVARRLQETSEAVEVWRLFPNVPLGGIRDIRPALERLRVGANLDPSELLEVGDTLRASRRLRRFGLGLPGEKFPLLQEICQQMGAFSLAEAEINRCVQDDGSIPDQASPELAQIRRRIRATQERVRSVLEGFLRSPEQQKLLQELLITVRGDRYVLPVKQEYRNRVPGIVHDQSASGSTVFIEPMAVVELNNQLRSLEVEEKQAVEVVLRYLSGLLRRDLEALAAAVAALGELDFILAKGRLSQDLKCEAPRISQAGRLVLRQARHPLLGQEAVPLCLELGGAFATLVITGPNTGGKTVALKTVGLLTLMAQAGLLLPAEAGSEVVVFQRVEVDLGDEQSIEQSLSTFSAHMTNLVRILNRVDENTLVLLDELGAGTDPAEGSSLARAILEHLRRRGARTVATTHFSQLKEYAYTTPGVENASVEFDPRTLCPTYRLLLGLPGSSNALIIAQRLGLPQEVLAEAQAGISQKDTEAGEVLQHMLEDRRQAEEDRAQAASLRQQVEEAGAALQQEHSRWQEQKERLWQQARQEAREFVSQARRESEDLLALLRQAQRQARAGVDAGVEEGREAHRRLREMQEDLKEAERPRTGTAGVRTQRQLQPGDRVEVSRLNTQGEVLTVSGQGEVQVQVGALKLTLRQEELRLLAGREKHSTLTPQRTGAGLSATRQNIATSLDLRGLTRDEALEQVDKYLDDAVLTGLTTVTIIHGKGTGALRAAVQDYLTGHPQVTSFRYGEQGEGGLGVTVVSFQAEG